MMKYRMICLLLSLLMLAACAAPGPSQEGQQESVVEGGTQTEGTLQEKVVNEKLGDGDTEPTVETVAEFVTEPVAEKTDGGTEPVVEQVGDGGQEMVVDASPGPEEVVVEAPVETAPETPAAQWKVPTCSTIAGLPSIGWTPDLGKTVQAAKGTIQQGIKYTHGLVALKAANTLLAQHDDALYRSQDAGCTWTMLGKVPRSPLRLALGANDRVWAWSDNYDTLLRIDGTTIATIKPPVTNILGIGTDPNQTDLIRLGGKDGTLHETQDGGVSWKRLGKAPSPTQNMIGYRVAFDPNDLDHAIFGMTREGFYVTTDGGKNWTAASGLAQNPGDPVNGFNAVISPANGQIVWAQGIDLNQTSQRGSGKGLWHSTDGGKTFTKIVAHLQHNDVILTNGTHLVAHPTDANKLFWAFGTCASGYGTNLYMYDAGNGKLTWQNHPYPDFDEIVVSPADPKFLYLGIQTNSDPLCPKSE